MRSYLRIFDTLYIIECNYSLGYIGIEAIKDCEKRPENIFYAQGDDASSYIDSYLMDDVGLLLHILNN